MNQTILIFLAVAALIVTLYVLTVQIFFKESKELDKKIDYSKMKEWKDED